MLLYKARVRKGYWADSPANPERRQRRKRDDRDEPKRERRVTDLSGGLRRSMSEEVGESELSKDHRFALLQKYGIVAAKIDRKVVRPAWKNEKQFNQELNDWYRATKGLVPSTQQPQRKSIVRSAAGIVTAHTPRPRKLYTHPSQTALAARVREGNKAASRPWSQIRHKRSNSPTSPQGV